MPAVNDRLPRAVVFDLDGTLVDSVPDLQAALNWLLPQHGRRDVAREEVIGMVGDGIAKLVERAFAATGGPPDGRLEDLIGVFSDHYEAHAVRLTTPFPGAITALAGLQDAGCRLGICTNKPEGATHEVLRALDLACFFEAVAGGDTLPGVRKPDPAHPAHVLNLLGVEATSAVMVGDSANDIRSGKGAGMPTVAVTFGYAHGPVAELGADVLIDHFDDLLEAVVQAAA